MSYEDERDYIFLEERINHKFTIVKANKKDIPILSPTFLVTNNKGIIINAHTYIKEFAEVNKLFFKTVNNIL